MEKIRGVKLSQVWKDLDGMQKCRVVQQLAEMDGTFASKHFPAYGSLYYATDLSGSGISVPSTEGDGNSLPEGQFCVGPTNGRSHFDDNRGALDIDRGPCEQTAVRAYD